MQCVYILQWKYLRVVFHLHMLWSRSWLTSPLTSCFDSSAWQWMSARANGKGVQYRPDTHNAARSRLSLLTSGICFYTLLPRHMLKDPNVFNDENHQVCEKEILKTKNKVLVTIFSLQLEVVLSTTYTSMHNINQPPYCIEDKILGYYHFVVSITVLW